MKSLFIFFLFFCFYDVHAAVPVFQHHNFNSELLNNNVKAITQDHQGFMWIGTTYGLFNFDGHQFKKIPTRSIAAVIDIFYLYADDKENIWISTKNNGLLVYKNKTIQKVDFSQFNVKKVFEVKADKNGQLWVATDQGIFHLTDQFNAEKPQHHILNQFSEVIRNIDFIDKDRVVLTGHNNFFIVDMMNNTSHEYLVNNDKSEYIHDVSYDGNHKLWIGTTKQLYIFNITNQSIIKAPFLFNSYRVFSLALNKKDLWVATIGGGIFKIDTQDYNNIKQFTHDKNYKYSLSEQYIMSLFISQDNNLWIGGFSKGLNVLHLDSMKFQYDTNVKGSFSCAKSALIHDIDIDEFGHHWLSHEFGLIKYEPKSQLCERFDLSLNDDKATAVYSTRIDGDTMWLSTSSGLLMYDYKANVSSDITNGLLDTTVFFSHQMSAEQLILGTSSGLYVYKINNKTLDKITINDAKFIDKSFVKYAANSKGELYLPTTSGLLHLDLQLNLVELSVKGNPFVDKEILMVNVNAIDEILVSVSGDSLYYLDHEHRIKKHYVDNEIFSQTNFIYQIQFEKNRNTVWMTSEDGLIYLNLESHQRQLFTGYSQYKYLSQIHSSSQHQGTFYFTGNTGFISFIPEDITFYKKNTQVVFDEFYVINDNKAVKQSVFDRITTHHDQIIRFNHKNKLIELEFVAPDYHNSSHITYAYKLKPVFNNWIELPQGDKRLTFTNLIPGQYDLSLKARNYDRSWSDQESHLSFAIDPAPWKTWWAYLIYTILFFLLLYFYLKNKINKEKKLNVYLNTQVEKQTEHIQKQKQKLEQLIVRKDEIFANVTHEFRTPITLIKGPINTLEKSEDNRDKLDMLSMMNRNANRLLNLVNQMLALSEIVDSNEHKPKHYIDVAKTLKMIVEPYAFVASKKGLDLTIDIIGDATIFATSDVLELTVGNFLSNAIKYTEKGGSITLATGCYDQNLNISVTDTGCGFDDSQVNQIFKRFGRLSQHHNVEGTGIGLALVKEAAKINGASIDVKSAIGQGTIFTISFPVATINDENTDLLKDKPENQASTLLKNSPDKETVLIIDDNKDMRDYIQISLQDSFQCLVAANGQQGIALALKNVPDIIICDVMMPGIDGFHVCRLLREDMITSHIPLILLTALTEKSSRIKGWRENIDMYLNKPFDADELNLQLRNILNVRGILNKKSQTAVNTQIKDADFSHLSEIDQKFIDKLTDTVMNNFRESTFNLKSLAQAMFVSERQLQRKTKALLDVSPVDYIREFRLKVAVKLLKEGHQISIASDNSGFGSLSSFSQSFKKHYGMTPKEYQKLNQVK